MKNISLAFFVVFSLIAGIGLFMTVNNNSNPNAMIVQTPTSAAPKTILINIPFGGRLGQYISGVGESTVSGLARGMVQTGEGRTYYNQNLIFNVPGFQGLAVDFRTPDYPQSSNPIETMYCMGGSQDAWAEYYLDFESSLISRIQNNELVDYQNENILMLGGIYSFVGATLVGTGANSVLELRLVGPGGMIVITDNPNDATFTPYGIKINGENVPISVQMRGSITGANNKFSLSSIVMRFTCMGSSGALQVPKMKCVSQYLGYPLINPDFDLCLLGTQTGTSLTGSVVSVQVPEITAAASYSGSVFSIEHAGSGRLVLNGEGYSKVPLFYLAGGNLLPGKDGNQITWWVEQGAGANWISPSNIFITSSRANDDRAQMKVYQFRGADTNNNNLELRDWNGKTHTIPYDPATGDCINTIQNYGQGAICNYNAGLGMLAVDQNGDGTYNGAVNWVTSSNMMINLGPQAPGGATTISYTVLSRRLPEGGANVVVQTSIAGTDPIQQTIVNTGTCPLTADYNYQCMSLRRGSLFSLDDREHGGDIYVQDGQVSSTVTVGTTTPSAGQAYFPSVASRSGGTNIVLTFEGQKLRGD